MEAVLFAEISQRGFELSPDHESIPRCSAQTFFEHPYSAIAQCLLATVNEIELVVSASPAMREQAEALVASILKDDFETDDTTIVNPAW